MDAKGWLPGTYLAFIKNVAKRIFNHKTAAVYVQLSNYKKKSPTHY